MTEWPCLLVEEMVRAVIENRKTVTRRMGGFWHKVKPGDRLYIRETWALVRPATMDGKYVETWEQWSGKVPRESPCGGPGPRSWVVLFRANHFDDPDFCDSLTWHPSIHQPRWATRELLEVVSNREEPLHAITEEDAVREGVLAAYERAVASGVTMTDMIPSARRIFARLWDDMNGERAPWKSKPDVRRVEFRRLSA